MGKTLRQFCFDKSGQMTQNQPKINYWLSSSFFYYFSPILTFQTQLSVCPMEHPNNIPNISAQPLDLTYGKSTVSVVLVIPFASIKEHQRIGSHNMGVRAAHHGKLSPSRDASVIVLSSDEASPTSLTQPSTSKWLVEAPIRQPGYCFSAVSAQKCIFIHTQ